MSTGKEWSTRTMIAETDWSGQELILEIGKMNTKVSTPIKRVQTTVPKKREKQIPCPRDRWGE